MRWLLAVAAVALPFAVAAIAGDGSAALRAVATAAVLLPLLLWVIMAAPVLLLRLFGVVLGAVPFATLPGVPMPVVLLLAALVGLTTAVAAPRRGAGRFGALEWATVALVVVSLASMLAGITSGYDVSEFVKWLLGTSVVLSLARVTAEQRRATGRAFVIGAAVAAPFAAFLQFFDPSGSGLSLLAPIGYGAGTADNLRYVVGSTGETVRLTGTWVDPNVAGLFLLVGAVLALCCFRGAPRVVLALELAAAMVLTLSRAALFSAAVAVAVALAVQHMRFGRRLRLLTILAIAAAAALLVPSVQDRLLESFGSHDAGTSARLDALGDFTRLLDGHWLFGLGWGRIEFRDPDATAAVNFVANSPLLTVYRGGVIDGLAFVAVIVAGLVRAVRGLRGGRLEDGLVGAAFVGFALVALQVDFPVVTIAPVTALYGLLLAALPRPEPTPTPMPPIERANLRPRTAVTTPPGHQAVAR
jgi:polysaccharide biosynthesis protein PslJ